jgi:predicted ATPase with chaperone activity
MALSQSDLDTLDSAIASGTLSVEFDGRKVTYQTTAQLIAARNHVATVVNGASLNRGPRSFRFNFTTSRGD